MRLDKTFVSLDKITSFESILTELTVLESKLPQNKLRQLLVFNKAYFVITSSIKHSSDSGYFDNPAFIEKFTVCFAQYYFRAVNDTFENSSQLPTAWSMLNGAATHKSTPNFIFLLMGANAHINNDLPLALLRLVGKEETNDLLKDVFKIDKLLMKSGRDIIGKFEEQNALLDLLKRRLIFVYYRPVMYMVLYWRIKAWRNYKSLKKNGLQKSAYAKYSIKVAARLLKLAALVSTGKGER